MREVSDKFLAAVAGSHRVASLVEVIDGDGDTSTIETGIDGTVTLDQTAASRGRIDLTIVDDGTLGLVPTSSSSMLAPYGNELHVSRGVTYPDGSTELVALGVFRIDDVTVDDQPAGLLIQIAGTDRSAKVIDARFEEPYQIAAGTNYADAIQATIEAGVGGLTFDFASTTNTTPQLVANEGDDRWKFCQDMAAAIGMSIYFDGDGVCVLRPVTLTNADSVAEISEGEGGVLLSANRRWTRQGSFNRVIATGENTGDDSAPARGVATDDNPLSPTYYLGPFGKVPRFYSSPFITTDDQAASAATAILARELGTSQQISFGSIVNPALEPDDMITVVRSRAGIDDRHIIDQITIPLTADQGMSGRTRAVVATA